MWEGNFCSFVLLSKKTTIHLDRLFIKKTEEICQDYPKDGKNYVG